MALHFFLEDLVLFDPSLAFVFQFLQVVLSLLEPLEKDSSFLDEYLESLVLLTHVAAEVVLYFINGAFLASTALHLLTQLTDTPLRRFLRSLARFQRPLSLRELILIAIVLIQRGGLVEDLSGKHIKVVLLVEFFAVVIKDADLLLILSLGVIEILAV